MAIEIIKNGSQEKIDAWEKAHDKRKTWQCNRCGCEWKCEWKDNKFGSIQDYNGDPDILCPECGSNDTKEFVSGVCDEVDFTKSDLAQLIDRVTGCCNRVGRTGDSCKQVNCPLATTGDGLCGVNTIRAWLDKGMKI